MKHNTALIILYDFDRRFLLQHRTSDAKILPDYWAFFGGGIENNETPEDAIERETFEELNYKLKDMELFLEQSFKIKGIYDYRYFYIDAFHNNKSELILNEGQGWGWFNLAEAAGLKMADNDRHVIEMFNNYLDNGKKPY